MKTSRLPSALGLLLRPKATPMSPLLPQLRCMHRENGPSSIPSPIPLVPDVQTFLTVIGRGLSQHASKFPTWDALFSLTSPQLKELGIEPPRSRRYLIQWRQKFRLGKFGVGGDLKHVENGTAQLRVLEDEKDPLSRTKYVVNVPAGQALEEVSKEELVKVKGYKVRGAKTIAGPYALPLQGAVGSQITVTEGMWEEKRGHKVDGGERRRAEVRFKKRAAERRALRERQGFY